MSLAVSLARSTKLTPICEYRSRTFSVFKRQIHLMDILFATREAGSVTTMALFPIHVIGAARGVRTGMDLCGQGLADRNDLARGTSTQRWTPTNSIELLPSSF